MVAEPLVGEREPVEVEPAREPTEAAAEPVPLSDEPIAEEPESDIETVPQSEPARPESVELVAEPVAVEPETVVARSAPKPEQVSPQPQQVTEEPKPAAVQPDVAPASPPAVEHRARRRSVLNDRPRRQSSRRPAAEVTAAEEVGAMDAPEVDEPEQPRRRRGLPADRPRRPRARRRFDDIPRVDAVEDSQSTAPAPGATSEPEPDWLVQGPLRLRRSTKQAWVNDRPIVLTESEAGVLELLMRNGGEGVTPHAIIAAAGVREGEEGWVEPDAIVAQLRRKTGVRGRSQGVRKERVLLYFFGDDEPPDA